MKKMQGCPPIFLRYHFALKDSRRRSSHSALSRFSARRWELMAALKRGFSRTASEAPLTAAAAAAGPRNGCDGLKCSLQRPPKERTFG